MNPYATPEYTRFVECMADKCECEPSSVRPCDGVLAGGLCDGIDWSEGRYDDDGFVREEL